MPRRAIGRVPSVCAMRKNSHAASAEAMASTLASAQSPYHTAPSTTGMATSAKRTRCVRFDRPPRPEGSPRAGAPASVMMATAGSGGDLSESALAALILENRLEQIAAREVRPQHGDDVQLRVRELPEEEVRDPLLARGANEQIRVG